jgi:hypothetical protein
MRTDGKGPADREIATIAKVCGEEHGGPNNPATVYGHFGSTKTCVRIGTSNTWVYDIRRAPTAKKGAW